MKASSHLTVLVIVLVSLVSPAAPVIAEDGCDLSFTSDSCTELPCPSGGYQQPECPYPDGTSPFPDAPPYVCHPYPQPRPAASKQCTDELPGGGYITQINSGEGPMAPSNPFNYETFPGTNLLPNVYTNVFDGMGNEMPNTLPSTPYIP